jgi:hypothetical protein
VAHHDLDLISQTRQWEWFEKFNCLQPNNFLGENAKSPSPFLKSEDGGEENEKKLEIKPLNAQEYVLEPSTRTFPRTTKSVSEKFRKTFVARIKHQ